MRISIFFVLSLFKHMYNTWVLHSKFCTEGRNACYSLQICPKSHVPSTTEKCVCWQGQFIWIHIYYCKFRSGSVSLFFFFFLLFLEGNRVSLAVAGLDLTRPRTTHVINISRVETLSSLSCSHTVHPRLKYWKQFVLNVTIVHRLTLYLI